MLPPLNSHPQQPKADSSSATSTQHNEYGAELGPDARVWATYVREADQCDFELVEKWNKSLDVSLVFAALFSAILTAFVIEKTKGLQSDPAEISVNYLQANIILLQETNTLLRALVLQNSTLAEISPVASSYVFIPSRTTIWVNALWYLSLALSVTSSLISMSAKRWCYAFVSGRSGAPYTQARLRQRRLEELERWRMVELLNLLPLLIELSLFLFSVGMCVDLLSIHTGVAVPVVVVVGLAVAFYFATTVLILKYEHCPYQTPLSPITKYLLPHVWRIIKLWVSEDTAIYLQTFIPRPTHKQIATQQEPIMDMLTSRALVWLISNSENTCSVDIALQALAGADLGLPVQPLDDCAILDILSNRFTSCFTIIPGDKNANLQPISKNLTEQASRYGRALAFVVSAKGFDFRNEFLSNNHNSGVRKAYECLALQNSLLTRASAISGLAIWTQGAGTLAEIPGLATQWHHYCDKNDIPLPGSIPLGGVDLIALEVQRLTESLFSGLNQSGKPLQVRALLGFLKITQHAPDRITDNKVQHILRMIAAAFVSLCCTRHNNPANRRGANHQQINILAAHATIEPDHLTMMHIIQQIDIDVLWAIGLLGLLHNRRAYGWSDAEVHSIVICFDRPGSYRRLSGRLRPTSYPDLVGYLEVHSLALGVLLDLPKTNGLYRWTIVSISARCSSLSWGTGSSRIYDIISHDLRRLTHATSSYWELSLSLHWEEDGENILAHINQLRTVRHIVMAVATASNERKIIAPFAMYHLWMLVIGMVGWISSLKSISAIHQNAFNSLRFELGASSSHPRSTLLKPADITLRNCGIFQVVERWIPCLEELAQDEDKYVDVKNSCILATLLRNQDILRLYGSRLQDIVDRYPVDPPKQPFLPRIRRNVAGVCHISDLMG